MCIHSKVKCQYCQDEVSRDSLEVHHRLCPEFPVPCQFSCSTALYPRKHLASHHLECPRAPVQCSMAPFGCTEQVERGDLPSHLLDCAPRHAANMGTMILKLQKEVESLKSQVNQQSVTISQLDDTLYPSAGQFTWRIDNIREKIKSAQAGDPATSVIYSPPFYSSEAGYKLCLCIYPAGDHNHGYLSLYFVLMKGKFDEVLPWPFQRRVYLSLLNCRYVQCHVLIISPHGLLTHTHTEEVQM